MVYAQVLNQTIMNTIIVQDASLLTLFSVDPVTGVPFDYLVQVDNIFPQPGIGWTFDNIMWNPPPAIPNEDDGGS